MTNNKWGLNSLRGYDGGLMPSIRSNVILGLQNNLGLNIVKNLRVDIYYGYVDDSNFYNAKTINFTDFTNTNYIFWFTVGIFTTVISPMLHLIFYEDMPTLTKILHLGIQLIYITIYMINMGLI